MRTLSSELQTVDFTLYFYLIDSGGGSSLHFVVVVFVFV